MSNKVTLEFEIDSKGTVTQINQVAGAIDGVDKVASKSSSTGGGLHGMFKSFVDIKAGMDVFIGGATSAIGKINEMAQAGNKQILAMEAFNRQAPQAAAWLDQMAEAADGLADADDIAAESLKVMQNGMIQTAADARKLADLGSTLGRAFGQDAAQGIGTLSDILMMVGSERGLRQFGIETEGVMKRWNELKKSMADDQAWKTAVFEAATKGAEKFKGTIIETGTEIDKLTAWWNNLKGDVEKGIAGTINISVQTAKDIQGMLPGGIAYEGTKAMSQFENWKQGVRREIDAGVLEVLKQIRPDLYGQYVGATKQGPPSYASPAGPMTFGQWQVANAPKPPPRMSAWDQRYGTGMLPNTEMMTGEARAFAMLGAANQSTVGMMGDLYGATADARMQQYMKGQRGALPQRQAAAGVLMERDRQGMEAFGIATGETDFKAVARARAQETLTNQVKTGTLTWDTASKKISEFNISLESGQTTAKNFGMALAGLGDKSKWAGDALAMATRDAEKLMPDEMRDLKAMGVGGPGKEGTSDMRRRRMGEPGLGTTAAAGGQNGLTIIKGQAAEASGAIEHLQSSMGLVGAAPMVMAPLVMAGMTLWNSYMAPVKSSTEGIAKNLENVLASLAALDGKKVSIEINATKTGDGWSAGDKNVTLDTTYAVFR